MEREREMKKKKADQCSVVRLAIGAAVGSGMEEEPSDHNNVLYCAVCTARASPSLAVEKRETVGGDVGEARPARLCSSRRS